MATQLNLGSIEPAAAVATPPSPPAILSSNAPAASAASPVAPASGANGADTVKAASDSSAATLRAVARQIDSFMKSTGRQLNFSVDEQSGRSVVTVRDTQTGDVIRQIPSEEALRLAHALDSNNPSALLDLIV